MKKETSNAIFGGLGCLVVLFVCALVVYGLWEVILLIVEKLAHTIKNA